MLPQRRTAIARLYRGLSTLSPMSDSLLDSGIMVRRNALLDMGDSPQRRELPARLELLERASWAMGLSPASHEQIIQLAKAILDLRDEAVAAQKAALGLPRFVPASEPSRRYLAG